MSNTVHISDISRNLTLRLANVSAKSQLNTLTQELSSGIKSNIIKSLNGNLSTINSIEHQIKNINSYQAGIESTIIQLDSVQASISSISSITSDLSTSLISEAGRGSDQDLKIITMKGYDELNSVINYINITANGRYSLSGSKTDTAPLPPASNIIKAITTSLPNPHSADDIIDVVEEWFSTPAEESRFVKEIYQGSITSKTTTLIGNDSTITINTTALDKGFLETIKGATLLAISDALSTTLTNTEVRSLALRSGQILASSNLELSDTRAEIGIQQQKVSHEKTRQTAELLALDLSRSNLLVADRYETASALIEAEMHLQNILTLSSRILRLSLSDYLR